MPTEVDIAQLIVASHGRHSNRKTEQRDRRARITLGKEGYVVGWIG